MRIRRLYLPGQLEPGIEHELDSHQAHYLNHVLRLSRDDALQVFDDTGSEYQASISLPRTPRMRIRIGTRVLSSAKESPLRIWLYPALTKGNKMDWIIEKATELGVCGIRPVVTLRSPVRLPPDREQVRVEHWNRIAQSAAAQSGRSVIPRCTSPFSWEKCLTSDPEHPWRWILTPGPGGGLNRQQPPPSKTIHLLVGPEGGFTPEEVNEAVAAGFTTLPLGPRILRTETAPLVAISVLQTLWGDLIPDPEEPSGSGRIQGG